MSSLDVNGDGNVDITDIIIMALKTPGVKIDRELFLKQELLSGFGEEVTNNAIKTTPLTAGISNEKINDIANALILSQNIKVSGTSAVLGSTGGLRQSQLHRSMSFSTTDIF